MQNQVAELLAEIVGKKNINCEHLENFEQNSLSSPRKVKGVVSAANKEQVKAIIKVFNDFQQTFTPLSSGKNWGYGGASPVQNDSWILDLSLMKQIKEINTDLHYVVVEPGVTQADLFQFLKERKINFMVPTTGAGPDVSLLGNALERGYGITPHEDHFQSLLALKAILADGREYNSSLHELGGSFIDQLFKWKVGPYLDGLFTQSNLGVVIEGTIALVPKPANVTQFLIFLNDEDFESGVLAVRKIKTELGANVGGVNLMNKRRLLSMIESSWDKEKALEEIQIIEWAQKRDLPDWAIVGAMYGSNELVAASKKIINRIGKRFAKKIVFLSKEKVKWAQRVLTLFPIKKYRLLLENASRALEILEGTPSKVALPLAYLKNPKGIPEDGNMNPDRDHCGLIWFAPLLPLSPEVVRDFAQEVTRICLLHNIEPLITLTAFSSRCFDSTIPILYVKGSIEDEKRAKKCLEDLLKESQLMGLFPYRLDINHMDILKGKNITAFALAGEIKKVMDPKGIIAPGRYVHL